MDLTGLKITVDSTGVTAGKQEAVSGLDAIGASATKTEQTMKELQGAIASLAQSAAGLQAATTNLAGGMTALEGTVAGLSEATVGLQGALAGVGAAEVGVSEATLGLEGSLGAVGAEAAVVEGEMAGLKEAAFGLKEMLFTLGVAFSFEKLIETMRGFQQMQTTMEAVTGSTKAAEAEWAFFRGEVDKLGLNLLVAGQGYATFLASVKNTNLEGEHARTVFIGVSEALTALHLSTDRQQRAFLAVQEIASQGTITAAHLTRQLAIDIPGAANLMAKGLGVTTAQLHELMHAGLDADTGLTAMAKAMHEQYGKAALDAKDLTQGLTNQVKTAMAEMEKVVIDSGFEQGFANMMRRILAILKDPAFQAAARELGHDLSSALTLIANAAAVLAKNFDFLINILKALLYLKVAEWFLALSPLMMGSVLLLGIGYFVNGMDGMVAVLKVLIVMKVAAFFLELIPLIEGATIAMTAFNLTNPVGWMAILAGLTFAGITALAHDLDQASQSARELKENLPAGLGEKQFTRNTETDARFAFEDLLTSGKRTFSQKQIDDVETGKPKKGELQKLIDLIDTGKGDKLTNAQISLITSGQGSVDDIALRDPAGLSAKQRRAEEALEKRLESARSKLEGFRTQLEEANATSLQKINLKWDEHLRKVEEVFQKFPSLRAQYGSLEQDVVNGRHAAITAVYRKEADFLRNSQETALDKLNQKWDDHEKKVTDILGNKIPQASKLWHDMEDERWKEVEAHLKTTNDELLKMIANLDSTQKRTAAQLKTAAQFGLSDGKNVTLEPEHFSLMTKAVDLLQNSVGGVTGAFTRLFDSIGQGTTKTGALFKSMATSIIAEIEKMIVKMFVMWAIEQLVGFLTPSWSTNSSVIDQSQFSNTPIPLPPLTPPGMGPPTFAGGGIMTSKGPLELATYSMGGVANRPQMAIFGEGDQSEAYVPLPDGRRIPVAMQGHGGGPAHTQPAQPARVTLNLSKNGSPVQAQANTRFDQNLQETVINVILDDMNNNGPLRRSGIGRQG